MARSLLKMVGPFWLGKNETFHSPPCPTVPGHRLHQVIFSNPLLMLANSLLSILGGLVDAFDHVGRNLFKAKVEGMRLVDDSASRCWGR